MNARKLLIALILLSSCQIIGQTDSKKNEELSSKIDSILVSGNFNGVVFLTQNNSEIHRKAIGYSELEKRTPLKVDDQFVIGSISKQITAVLVLREYEKGKIKLEESIGHYLKELNQPWSQEVTIHSLLTHTHGIVDLAEPLAFKPGTEFRYSQLGYELLARILEKVSGKSFQSLSSELFSQYELKNTFHPDEKKHEHLVKGYEENEKGIMEFTPGSLDNFVAAGSFISNAQDLITWNQLLHSGKLVKTETLALMTTKYATRIHPVFDRVEYGYGLLFHDGEQRIQIGALGYVPGFVSASYYFPQTDMNLVILENTVHDPDDLKKTFHVHTEIMELIKRQTP